MEYIGKIDRTKLGKYCDKVITQQVVLTEERKKHIQERHLEDYEKYGKYIKAIMERPNYVLEDTKNLDTIILLKRIVDEVKNLQIIIKLSTGADKKRDKNSILSFWKVRNSTYARMVKNKKILYKSE